jgi:hypothetical protein
VHETTVSKKLTEYSVTSSAPSTDNQLQSIDSFAYSPVAAAVQLREYIFIVGSMMDGGIFERLGTKSKQL